MKKLLLAFTLSIITSFVAQAQDSKPSKEETQRFLNSMVTKVIGGQMGSGKINNQSFNSGFDTYKYELIMEGYPDYYDNDEISLIKWESVIEFGDAEDYYDYERLTIYFGSNVKAVHRSNMSGETSSYIKYLNLSVPKGKSESVRKAILHLSEIAKEENKDPFQN